MTKENVAEENSPAALANIVSELKNEVNQLNGRVTRLEIMKPPAQSFENRRSRRGSPDNKKSTNSKSPPKPCLVREACAFDYKINTNSTIIPPNGGQPASCSDLSQLGYTLNGFYLIKSAAANSLIDTLGFITQLEAVFCGFTKPEGPLNSPAIEKRIGFLKLDANASSPSIEQGNEVTNEPSKSKTNIERLNSCDRLIFHLQIKSNGIIQNPGDPIVFDKIILNADKSYDPKTLAFFAPVTGNYKFVFEAKVLEEKNVTFRYAGRTFPNYIYGWTLTEATPSDLKNNVVKMETTSKLDKSTRIQLKSVNNKDGTYTLSASYPTSFKGYLLL